MTVSPRSTISIVIPVYNNQESLSELVVALREVEGALGERGVSVELIFVNDGSFDDSLSALKRIQVERPQTIVLSHLSNFGAIQAIKSGFQRVTGDCFMFLAADLQDPPSLIPEMVDAWRSGHRFVVATRRSRADPISSQIFSWLNYRIVRAIVMPNFPKRGFDLMLMDKVMLPHLLRCGHNKHLGMYAWSMRVPAKILEYDRQARKHGTSMWTFRKKVNFFIDSTVGFSVWPLRLASGVGFLVASASFLYAATVFSLRLLGFTEVPGFATLAVLLSFLNGCVIMFLGLLGEYVWRIYRETERHPEPIVQEVSSANTV